MKSLKKFVLVPNWEFGRPTSEDDGGKAIQSQFNRLDATLVQIH